MRPREKHHRGQTTLLFVLALVPMLGMAGLAVDVGRMYTERRRAQAAADLAASAGAQEMSRTGAHATFADVANTYASRNGFATGNGDTITLNNPPQSGPYTGNPDAYEVIIRRPVSTTLLQTLGTATTTVEGRAVALVAKSGLGIVVLEPSKADAFKMNKNSAIRMSFGTLFVNSTSSNAIHVQDNSVLAVASKAGVVGGYKIDGKAQLTPPPATGAAPMADPLADLPRPPCSLPTRNGTPSNPQKLDLHGKTMTLLPGIYWGGLKADGKSKLTFDTSGVSADEAIYVFTGEGFHLHDSTLTASGAMIFNTVTTFCNGTGTTPAKGGKCGSLHFDPKATVDLTAPSAGTWEGLTVFEDPLCNKKFDLSGKALGGITGEVYLPAGELRLKGKKKTSMNGTIRASFVVKKMSVGEFIGTDDLDEDDGDEDLDAVTDDPDLGFTSNVGASGRRVTLGE